MFHNLGNLLGRYIEFTYGLCAALGQIQNFVTSFKHLFCKRHLQAITQQTNVYPIKLFSNSVIFQKAILCIILRQNDKQSVWHILFQVDANNCIIYIWIDREGIWDNIKYKYSNIRTFKCFNELSFETASHVQVTQQQISDQVWLDQLIGSERPIKGRSQFIIVKITSYMCVAY